MASVNGAKWILGIIAYFILLASLFSLVNTFKDDYGLSETEFITSTGGSVNLENVDSICGNPRFNDEYENRYDTDPHYNRLLLVGLIYDENSCEQFTNATWVETPFLLSWFTSDFRCEGVIPTNAYNFGEVYTDVASFGYWKDPVCGLGELQTDKNLCEAFGCTYYVETVDGSALDNMLDNSHTVSGLLKFINMIKKILTFRLDFYTGSLLLNGLLTFFLIWLPIIGIMLAIYEMIRG